MNSNQCTTPNIFYRRGSQLFVHKNIGLLCSYFHVIDIAENSKGRSAPRPTRPTALATPEFSPPEDIGVARARCYHLWVKKNLLCCLTTPGRCSR